MVVPDQAGVVEPVPAARDIRWEQLEKPKFYALGTSMFFCIRALVYPSILVKTRIIISKQSPYASTFAAYGAIIRAEGFFALYKGFMWSAIGFIPNQAFYVTSYELVRAVAAQAIVRVDPGIAPVTKDFLANLLGGGMASTFSQLVLNPIDTVTQRLMIQRHGATAGYKNGLDALTTIVAKEGFFALYRGILPSMLTNIPGSAIWWSFYGLSKAKVGRALQDAQGRPLSYGQEVLVQIVSAVFGSTASVTLTQPMDVVKTQMQTGVLDSSRRHTILSVWRKLLHEEGVKGLTKGWAARCMASVPVSSLSMLSYELLKRLSLKEEFRVKA